MRLFLFTVVLLIFSATAGAQQIRISGQVVAGGKPMSGVMIMVFEKNKFYKKFITEKKGDFRFAVGDKDYIIMFYKPGMKPEAYHVINRMDNDVLKMPIYMEMSAATENPDSALVQSPMLTQADPDVARAYIASVYEYERSRKKDTSSIATRRTLIRKAVEERNRFSTYKKTTQPIHDKDSTEKTTIVIGPDTYDMLTNPKGEKRYYKKQKPVTETTYLFETTRRYEGVLKNKRDVKRFEKYKPMEHVK